MTNENVLGWIGYVPQEHILFSKQREKIFYSEIGKRRKKNSRKRLKSRRLKGFRVLPEGLETLVGEKGVSLSGGQNKGSRLRELLFKIQKF